ncbi:murein hydrolase activator EnvC family protein [Streptomyces sp. NBC_01525]|uniref:murein hydrolase activator EnvC family protein n=1 Tax=Streptomyces sp. NBC_01525 TaxID=2903893 RepID=UPI00386CE143
MRLLPPLPSLRVLPGRLRPSSPSGPRTSVLPSPASGSRRPWCVRRFGPLGARCRARPSRSSGPLPRDRCWSAPGEAPVTRLNAAAPSARRSGSHGATTRGRRPHVLDTSGFGRCVRTVQGYGRRLMPVPGPLAQAPESGPARPHDVAHVPAGGVALQVTGVSARGALAALMAFAAFASLAALTGVAAARAGGRGAPAEPGPTAPQAAEAPPPTSADRAWPVDGEAGSRPTILRGWEPPPAPWAPGHRGVDLAAAPGTTIRAAAPGEVTFAGVVAGRGVLTIQLSGTGEPPLRTTYEPVRASVRKGDRVDAGQPVGILQQGPFHCHEPCLHWGLLHGRTYLDPLTLIPPRMQQGGPSRLLPLTGVPVPPERPRSAGPHTDGASGGRETFERRATADGGVSGERRPMGLGIAWRPARAGATWRVGAAGSGRWPPGSASADGAPCPECLGGEVAAGWQRLRPSG